MIKIEIRNVTLLFLSFLSDIRFSSEEQQERV